MIWGRKGLWALAGAGQEAPVRAEGSCRESLTQRRSLVAMLALASLRRAD